MSNKNNINNTTANTVLCIDVGNSALKWAIYNQKKWSVIQSVNSHEPDIIKQIIDGTEAEISAVLVSSVVQKTTSVLNELDVKLPIRIASVEGIRKDRLNYKTPESLGIDRYLACLGGYSMTHGGPVIVIDSGTACTIDLMDEHGVYQGGVIMPGLKLMEQGLSNSAPALPNVERDVPEQWPGKSTEECLQWGLSVQFIMSIENFIEKYINRFGSSTTFITGGEARFIAKRLSFDATADPHLVMRGLIEHFNITRQTSSG